MKGYKSTGYKDSRELANKLRGLAEFLESRETFTVSNGCFLSNHDGKASISMDDKSQFVTAVKAIGDAEKHYTDGEYSRLVISAKYAPLEISILRDKVCKKTVVFDCEPLFSVEEVEAL